MDINDINEILSMCDDAIQSLSQHERTGDAKDVFKKIRSVGDVCMENNDIHPDLKKNISIKSQYDFKTSIFNLSRLATLSGGVGNNQQVRNNLSNIKSTLLEITKLYKKTTDEKKTTVFYSWQSDLPNSTNRSFIKTAVEKAIKQLNKSFDIESRLSFDSDTANIPGSPDIINTILEKIDNSAVFIADVSLINSKHPNSNVMFELGYAMKSLSDVRIIMIFNEAYGVTKDLPFDLGFKRQMIYKLSQDDSNKVDIRNDLVNRIGIAIRSITESE